MFVYSYLPFGYRQDEVDTFYVIYFFQNRHVLSRAALSYVTVDYLPYLVSTLQQNIRTSGSFLMFSKGIGNEQ